MSEKDEAQVSHWPTPKFHFIVEIPGVGAIAFQEVSGLDTELDIQKYRADSKDIYNIKMPGLKKESDVILKKGMIQNGENIFNYLSSSIMNVITRKDVTISLIDQGNSKTLFTWTLKDAFPIKFTSTDLKSSKSNMAIEEVVLGHEGITMNAK